MPAPVTKLLLLRILLFRFLQLGCGWGKRTVGEEFGFFDCIKSKGGLISVVSDVFCVNIGAGLWVGIDTCSSH